MAYGMRSPSDPVPTNNEGITVYHGTPDPRAARNIIENGPDTTRDNKGHYGPGFYVTTDRRRAEEYAYDDDGEVLEFRLNPKNLSTVPVHDDMGNITKEVGPEHDARKLGSDYEFDPLKNDYSVLRPEALTFIGSRNLASIRRARRRQVARDDHYEDMKSAYSPPRIMPTSNDGASPSTTGVWF